MPDLAVFIAVARNVAHAAPRTLSSVEAYVVALRARKPTDVWIYVYESGSTDDSRSVLTASFRSLVERGLADRAEVLDADPGERSSPRHWPVAPGGRRCAPAMKNCRLASLREYARGRVRERLGSRSRHGVVAVVFDADLWQLPTPASLARSYVAVSSGRLGAAFANGRQQRDGDYYDSFATVDLADRMGAVPRLSGGGGARFVRVRSGFGGLGVYSGAAYFGNCSYTDVRTLRHAKTTAAAWLDGVYGWPCEHATLHTCLSDAGHTLAIANAMRVNRIAGRRRGGAEGRLGALSGFGSVRDLGVAAGEQLWGWGVALLARAGHY